MHQMLATLATCHLFVLKLFCSSWAAAQSNMEAEISGYLSHTAILLASLVGTGCWLYWKAAKGDGPLNFSAASVQLQFLFCCWEFWGLLQVLQRLDQDWIGRLPVQTSWIRVLHRSGSGVFQISTGSFRTRVREGKNLGSDEMIWFCQNLIIYLIEISLRSQEVLLFLWPPLLPARNWTA